MSIFLTSYSIQVFKWLKFLFLLRNGTINTNSRNIALTSTNHQVQALVTEAHQAITNFVQGKPATTFGLVWTSGSG